MKCVSQGIHALYTVRYADMGWKDLLQLTDRAAWFVQQFGELLDIIHGLFSLLYKFIHSDPHAIPVLSRPPTSLSCIQAQRFESATDLVKLSVNPRMLTSDPLRAPALVYR